MSEASEMDRKLDAELGPLKTPAMSEELALAIKSAEPVKMRRPWRDLEVFLGLSIPMLALVAVIIGVRSDLSEMSPLWIGSVALVWFTSFATSSYLGFVPAKGHVRPRSQNIYQVVGAASLLLIAVGLFATQSATGQSMTYSPTFSNVMAHAPSCSILGVTAGIIPGIIALLLMRRYIPVGRWSVGLSLGAAGGSLSGLVSHLHCPITERFHVGLVHGGCLVLSALFVAGAGQVLLRDRKS
ncbi:MAG: DUF1109 domain-containing protein [Myxococcales bacterium]|nr:DUF1109 domain-containing protein [Myxococcales bacterium]